MKLHGLMPVVFCVGGIEKEKYSINNMNVHGVFEDSPQLSPRREARSRRCLEIQGFDESSPRPELGTKATERRERDKARRRTVQVVDPLVRAERRRFGLPHIALAKWGRCAPAAVGW